MRLLLDTHALLWWLAADTALHIEARRAIQGSTSEIFVSAASTWEIAIKRALGKLRTPGDLEDQLGRHDFQPLPITIGHAAIAGGLPRHHDDPFDRMLVAQAVTEGLVIVTRDARLALYGVATLAA
ncbi:MAG: PIN domain-containing protein [Dehalococcoidia bacterium]|nr:PIN domain-containing protein [Dehalococcoidia bacterium]